MKNITTTNLEPMPGNLLLIAIERKKMLIQLDDKSKNAYMDYQVVKGNDKLIGKCVVFDSKMLEQVTSVVDENEKTFWICPEKAVVCLK